jgi:hypothetical protein
MHFACLLLVLNDFCYIEKLVFGKRVEVSVFVQLAIFAIFGKYFPT